MEGSAVPSPLPTTGEVPPDTIIELQQEQPPRHEANVVDYMKMHKWASLVMGVCLTAVSVSLQAYNTTKPLPPIFHRICLALELSFLSLLVSIYIRRGYQLASLVLEHVAIFLGATAFIMAIGMNLPPPFMHISIALYFIAIAIIIFANLFTPSHTNIISSTT
ncbi:hypothetical protein ACH5RR_025439 [Cinchona calisaya]|uniref:Transmembrane protein n=1 Tax=Cinchona calisaya TaxID=153742 RepID=A0ABD2Z2U3_9GENT